MKPSSIVAKCGRKRLTVRELITIVIRPLVIRILLIEAGRFNPSHAQELAYFESRWLRSCLLGFSDILYKEQLTQPDLGVLYAPPSDIENTKIYQLVYNVMIEL